MLCKFYFFLKLKYFIKKNYHYHLRIQGGGARDARPPVQLLSFSCSFFQNSCQIIGSWPKMGNPGSATDYLYTLVEDFKKYMKHRNHGIIPTDSFQRVNCPWKFLCRMVNIINIFRLNLRGFDSLDCHGVLQHLSYLQ